MADLKLDCKIIKIFGIETRGNYSSNKMWIETKETYPQTLEVVTTFKKETLFDNLHEGQDAVLHCNLRGNKWTNPKDGKESVFNKLEIWKVEAQHQPTTTTSTGGNYNPPYNPQDDIDQPLPF